MKSKKYKYHFQGALQIIFQKSFFLKADIIATKYIVVNPEIHSKNRLILKEKNMKMN